MINKHHPFKIHFLTKVSTLITVHTLHDIVIELHFYFIHIKPQNDMEKKNPVSSTICVHRTTHMASIIVHIHFLIIRRLLHTLPFADMEGNSSVKLSPDIFNISLISCGHNTLMQANTTSAYHHSTLLHWIALIFMERLCRPLQYSTPEREDTV